MISSPSDEKYGLVAQALHWVMALLIIAAFVIIQIVDGMPKGPEKSALIGLHKSLGVGVLLLLVARVVWRHLAPPPELPDGTAAWIHLAAKGGHVALYALMAMVPVAGVVMSWAAGRPVAFFDLVTLPTLLAPDPGLKDVAKAAHELGGDAMMIVVGLHAAAALWHQYILKDGVLARMLPWGSRAS